MLSINTNLSSMIVQNSMGQATSKLNQAIERMSTGFKINHANDNAANYSISTNMTTKMSAYQVAEDNTEMGLDMVTSASETLSEMENYATRLRALATQAQNGTYGKQSLKDIQTEANTITAEIERLYNTAKYNGISLFEQSEYTIPEYLQKKWGDFLVKPDFEETEGFTIKTLTEAYNEGGFDPDVKYSISNADELSKLAEMVNNSVSTTNITFFLTNDIDLGHIDNWIPIGYETGAHTDKNFKGIFNGNGHVISNLKCNTPDYYVGLFGTVGKDGVVKNLGVEDIDIKSYWGVGGIIGLNCGGVNNSYATGQVKGDFCSGGLVGIMTASGAATVYVENCYTNVEVSGTAHLGGLAGYSEEHSIVNKSYSKGIVEGKRVAGGLIGAVNGSTITNSNSYCDVKTTILGEGSLIGALLSKGSDFNLKDTSILNCQTSNQNLSTIGGAFKYTGTSDHTEVDYDMSYLLSEITILNRNSVSTQLQVGINNEDSSKISFSKIIGFEFSYLKKEINSESMIKNIDEFINILSSKQTELGAVTNRLESALDEIQIQYDNLASSRSTLRDADMAELSSTYIQQQILQQASATLLATANQSPSIALQLI